MRHLRSKSQNDPSPTLKKRAMQNKKTLYGAVGGFLVLILVGVTSLFFGATKEPIEDRTAVNKARVKKPLKADIVLINKRLNWVETAVGKNPELDQLTAKIENPDVESELRQALVETLVRWPKPKPALQQVMKLLGALNKDPENEAVRGALVYGLGRFIGFERARVRLIESLAPATARNERLQALKVIGESSGLWIKPYLEPLVDKEPDPEIREQARRALAKVNRRSPQRN
jgi:hypothetical protein